MTTILLTNDRAGDVSDLTSWMQQNKPNWNTLSVNSDEEIDRFLTEVDLDCLIYGTGTNLDDVLKIFRNLSQQKPEAVRVAVTENAEAELMLESHHATHRCHIASESPESVCRAIEKSLLMRESILDPALMLLLSDITALPVLPAIYDQLMMELASEDFSIESVCQIIDSDMSLTATLLKHVNSPYYGLLQRVDTPAHAVKLLGIEVVKNILLSEQLNNQFKVHQPNADNIDQLNITANIRGVLANRFARLARLSKREIDHCHMSGMLSAVGSLMLETGMIPLNSDQTTQYSPETLGSSILASWSLPDSIVEAVFFQQLKPLAGDKIGASQVLQATRHLEEAFEQTGRTFTEDFTREQVFSDYPLDSSLLDKWFHCFCDYHLDLDEDQRE